MSAVLDSPARRFSVYGLLAPSGRRGKLLIFIFHRVLARPDPLLPSEPDAARFERIVSFVASNFNVLRLGDAVERLAMGSLPTASACITFDDGYADNFSVAAPILQRHRVPGTFFIATGYIDGGRMWNDEVIEAVRASTGDRIDATDVGLGEYLWHDAESRVAACERLLKDLKYFEPKRRREVARELAHRAGLPAEADTMMTPAQLRALADAGHELGGHTMTHPILATLSDAAAADEIGAGREQLAQWIGRPVESFAYPNGVPGVDYTVRDVGLVAKAGFRSAVSTRRGVATARSIIFELPRFSPWDRSMPKFALRCAQALATFNP
ncbi:polysaccharide deacetylase family protein [Piscinibacter koreensis]|uniref:Polysaccharide deacetylase family protein n=1 Tax=Piscinibacter koreensis TaxID=2742824 RepID=A0A7Y6TVL0_9BURK|nr:polysaccharide deacetylase family protein [Schlegelella koreensis]NUZ05150.1 polysaccharide deacetylase family protein [Schlegelella koreensis]